ncbi:MAG TPA: hypothetical protein VKU00_17955, partial [Chthonomonadaceae bacterium]|nr:hypothetical protein [Chthonomonadaceae bacterium]
MTAKSEPALQKPQSSLIVSTLRICAQVAAVATLVIGILGLLDGIIPGIKSVQPDLAIMGPGIALAFMLAGISLWLRRTEPPPRARRFTDACALAVLLIGLALLFTYVLPHALGAIPQLHPGIPASGGMRLESGVLFVALGLALLLLDVENRHGRRPAQYL